MRLRSFSKGYCLGQHGRHCTGQQDEQPACDSHPQAGGHVGAGQHFGSQVGAGQHLGLHAAGWQTGVAQHCD